ncbi:hypothetical protein D3C76_1773950 [compost metagenome]
MTKTALVKFTEQQKLFHERQRDLQAKVNEPLKYPYGPRREVFLHPLGLAVVLICIGGLLGNGLNKLALL